MSEVKPKHQGVSGFDAKLLATSLRCGWCLLDLTRFKSGRACLPRQARQPRQPDRRAPIYQQLECATSLACRLAAFSNQVGRSPTAPPLSDPLAHDGMAGVIVGKPFGSNPKWSVAG